MADDEDEGHKVIKLVLRNPKAVAQVEDLSHIPRAFDTLFNKPYYAHQLRLAGYDWHQIARKLEFPSAQRAENVVYKWLHKQDTSRALTRTREDIRQHAIDQEEARLNALQSVYWQDAMEGDLASANFVLKVIGERMKLRHLDEKTAAGAAPTFNTLVVGGDENSYVGALLKARDQLAGPHRVIDADDG